MMTLACLTIVSASLAQTVSKPLVHEKEWFEVERIPGKSDTLTIRNNTNAPIGLDSVKFELKHSAGAIPMVLAAGFVPSAGNSAYTFSIPRAAGAFLPIEGLQWEPGGEISLRDFDIGEAPGTADTASMYRYTLWLKLSLKFDNGVVAEVDVKGLSHYPRASAVAAPVKPGAYPGAPDVDRDLLGRRREFDTHGPAGRFHLLNR